MIHMKNCYCVSNKTVFDETGETFFIVSPLEIFLSAFLTKSTNFYSASIVLLLPNDF